jgi:hypothetical protein
MRRGLAEAMKANPDAQIATLAAEIGKSRTSTVSALCRLREAGLAESVDRVWTLVESPPSKEGPRWIDAAPISATRRRRAIEVDEREHAHA